MIRPAGDGEHRWFLGVLSTHKVNGGGHGRPSRRDGDDVPARRVAAAAHASAGRDVLRARGRGARVGARSAGPVSLGPGGLLCAPAGTPHSFRVESEIARMLILSTTSGIEDFVRDLSIPADGRRCRQPDAWRPTTDERVAVEAKHQPDLRRAAAELDGEERQLGLALAAQHGEVDLDAGDAAALGERHRLWLDRLRDEEARGTPRATGRRGCSRGSAKAARRRRSCRRA